jgi:Retrotransposon gag protein
MSSSNAAGQQPPSVSQQLVNSTNTIHKKVDQLAEIIAGLSISEDVREMIEQQLQGIKAKEVKVKLKALEHYDGTSRPLRSWLTEAELHMENKEVVGNDAMIRFIGGHLKGKAWNWFEPFMREKKEKDPEDWSDRTKRVFSSYKELRKAMTQVFGDIDERKTAARELQRLRQTSSVRNYITEFQMITANLEWDDEALEDKFMDGLKQNIRDALIFFPTNPRNLEELFERAQKIDREQWSGRSNHGWSGIRNKGSYPKNRNDQPRIKYDQQGDVVMTGAKVNLEEAKKNGNCYRCGMKGHYSRNCRQKTPRTTHDTPRDGNKIRMVRLEELHQNDTIQTTTEAGTGVSDETEDKETSMEESEKSLDVSAGFYGLTEKDFESSDQESDIATEVIDWKEALRNAEKSSERRIVKEWLKAMDKNVDTELTGRENSDKRESAWYRDDDPMKGQSSERIQEDPLLFEEKLIASRHFPNIVGEFTGRAKRRLNAVNFSKLSRKQPVWKEFCEQRTTETVKEYHRWCEKVKENDKLCSCYKFDPKCWARTGNKWMKHLSECQQCERWSKKRCLVPGHSTKSKRTTLIDVSERRAIPDVIRTNEGTTCCEEEVCLHEFMEHGKVDVPWWTCYNRDCAEHFEMKIRNGGLPEIPLVTILNNDKCPCLKKGCVCGMNPEHQFHQGLLTVNQCWDDKCTLHDTRGITNFDIGQEMNEFREEIRQVTEELRNLKEIGRIRSVTGNSQTKQMEAKVSVYGKEVEAIIDSGADINYVNRRWCDKEGIRYRNTGFGKIRAYDDSYTQDFVRKATFEFEMQGKTQRQIFHVLAETGKDNLVLGMPWLESENPDIDWKERTIRIRKRSTKSLSNGQGSERRALALRYDEPRTRIVRSMTQAKGKSNLAVVKEEGPDSERIGRAPFSQKQTHPDNEGYKEEKEYEMEIEEIKRALPKELWGYEDVFSSRK